MRSYGPELAVKAVPHSCLASHSYNPQLNGRPGKVSLRKGIARQPRRRPSLRSHAAYPVEEWRSAAIARQMTGGAITLGNERLADTRIRPVQRRRHFIRVGIGIDSRFAGW